MILFTKNDFAFILISKKLTLRKIFSVQKMEKNNILIIIFQNGSPYKIILFYKEKLDITALMMLNKFCKRLYNSKEFEIDICPLHYITTIKLYIFETFISKFGLTATEKSILNLKFLGQTRKKIAVYFFLSEGTIRNHISNILKKTKYPTIKKILETYLEEDLFLWIKNDK